MFGPFIKDERIPRVQWRYVRGHKQFPPYKGNPMPYYTHRVNTLGARTFGNGHGFTAGLTDSPENFSGPQYAYHWTSGPVGEALRFATEEFNSKLGTQAALAANALEYDSARASVVKRTQQLITFSKALKRLDFRTCGDALGLSSAQIRRYRQQYPGAYDKGKAASQDFASNFLEWHWGWSPIIDDVHTAMNILTSDKPSSFPILGFGSKTENWSHKDTSFGRRYWGNHTGRAKARVSARVVVTNPNVVLANQLGLLNPAATLWEVTPFSWLVDYFVNVSDVLGALSSRFGLELTEQQYCYHAFDHCVGGFFDKDANPIDGWEVTSSGYVFERVVGPPPVVSLGLRKKWMNPFRDSPSRAASMVSVLVQMIKPPPKSYHGPSWFYG